MYINYFSVKFLNLTQARLQRGNILLKQGELDEAHIDFEWVLRFDPYNEEANHHYSIIEPLKQDLIMADILYHDRNYMAAIEIYSKIILVILCQ